MVADVTVTRLADDRFRVVTGAGYLASDLAWLRLHLDGDDGRRRSATSADDARDDRAVGTAGARRPGGRDAPTSVGDAALPIAPGRADPGRGGAGAGAADQLRRRARLGADYVEPAWAVQVWDRLLAAGATHGLEPFGYRALDALRMEKGYRYFGTDLTMLDTPYEAGLGVLRPPRARASSSGATRSSRRTRARGSSGASGPSSSAATR